MTWEWVYIVIEWTGNEHEVDGAEIHGVFRRIYDAEAALGSLKLQRGHIAEILQRKLL